MSMRLSARLSAARHFQFVGRQSELALFKSALDAPELPFSVLYVCAPGGMGKTTLLKEFAYICEQQGVPSIYVDARNVEPTPEAFVSALQGALGISPPEAPLDVLESQAGYHVVLIDTYELLAPLDDWLREVFLPELTANTLIVLASRQPPSQAWRADPGWQTVIHTISLRNLSPEESRAYLTKRNLPAEDHDKVLDFTYGQPLAISLVADGFAQRGDVPTKREDAPDVIRTLAEQV